MPHQTRNILSGLVGGGLGGQPQRVVQGLAGLTNNIPQGLQSFPKELRADDFASAEVTISATDFTKLGTRTVSAQTIEAFGQGGPGDQTNQGFIRISPTDVAVAAIAGLVRLSVANSNETNTFLITENRTDRLNVNSTDRRLLVPLPLTFPAALEDSLLIISMNADTSTLWSPTASTFTVPITVFQ